MVWSGFGISRRNSNGATASAWVHRFTLWHSVPTAEQSSLEARTEQPNYGMLDPSNKSGHLCIMIIRSTRQHGVRMGAKYWTEASIKPHDCGMPKRTTPLASH